MGGAFGTFGAFSDFDTKPVGAFGDWRMVRSSGERRVMGERGSRGGGLGGVEARVMGGQNGARMDGGDGFLAGEDIFALSLCAPFQIFVSTFYFPPGFLRLYLLQN